MGIMTSGKAFLAFALVLPMIACGDGSTDPIPDAALTSDVARPMDVMLRDSAATMGDVPKTLDGPVDMPADMAKDGLVDAPIVDSAMDLPFPGEVGVSDPDGGADPDGGDVGEVGSQLNQAFPCTRDSDCCTVVDGCMARAYLYSKGVGASPAPAIPPNNGMCLSCIPPSIQLRCEAGTCVGEKVQGSDSRLIEAHCGYIPLTDASFHLSIDASVQPPKTSWSCGS